MSRLSARAFQSILNELLFWPSAASSSITVLESSVSPKPKQLSVCVCACVCCANRSCTRMAMWGASALGCQDRRMCSTQRKQIEQQIRLSRMRTSTHACAFTRLSRHDIRHLLNFVVVRAAPALCFDSSSSCANAVAKCACRNCRWYRPASTKFACLCACVWQAAVRWCGDALLCVIGVNIWSELELFLFVVFQLMKSFNRFEVGSF